MEELFIFSIIFISILFLIAIIVLIINLGALIRHVGKLNQTIESMTRELQASRQPQNAATMPRAIPLPSALNPQPSCAPATQFSTVQQMPQMPAQPLQTPLEQIHEKAAIAHATPAPIQPSQEVAANTPQAEIKQEAAPGPMPAAPTIQLPKPETSQKATAPEPVSQPPVQIPSEPVPQPAVQIPQTPRTPSQFELRIKALRNWFLYGNAAGKDSGESVEKMLATTWLLRAGILVILVTSAFLMKLSIDRGLLAPEGRVALCYVFGAVLLVAGLHRKLRKNYWSLGQALAGLGLGIFYFSSFAMVSMYHLVPPMVGGAVMVLITITAGLLADRFASLPIAIITMLGGFATPLLLSTGEKNFLGLSGYLLLLGAGVLWLANRRDWQQLTWLAMLFTYSIFGLAYQKHFVESDFAVYQTALVLFFILYSVSVFIHNIRRKLPASVLETIGLLGNSGFFFGLSCAAILAISSNDRLMLAPLTIGLSCFYLAHAFFLQKRGEKADRNLLLIFCAFAGFYLALTFPVVLTGHWLAPAWSLQALMMLWLGYKLESRFLQRLAWLLYAIALVRIAGWEFVAYKDLPQKDGAGFWGATFARCLQNIIPIVSMALAARLSLANTPPAAVDSSTQEEKRLQQPDVSLMPAIAFTLSFVVCFIFLLFELTNDLSRILPAFMLAGVNLVWVAGACVALILLGKSIPGYWKQLFYVLITLIIVNLFADFFKPWHWDCCHPSFLWSYSIGLILNTLILAGGIWFVSRLLSQAGISQSLAQLCGILWPILLFVHATREMQTIIDYKLPGLAGGGISVLWSIFAFVSVFNGLRQSRPLLRLVGLGLFTVIVIKVFLFDMQQLDAVYRILAFLAFGVLLMGAAFIYLKFWHGKDEK